MPLPIIWQAPRGLEFVAHLHVGRLIIRPLRTAHLQHHTAIPPSSDDCLFLLD